MTMPSGRVTTGVLLGLALVCAAPLRAQEQPVVVVVVRHAERAEDGTDDPPISAAGRERAELLVTLLRDVRLTHIHSTDYLRTRSTAEPVGRETGLTPALYDPDDLAGFAARLGTQPGRHLVVGHSNTIPPLVSALGGDPGEPIATDEYDRLYVLTIARGAVTTVLLRFGPPYRP